MADFSESNLIQRVTPKAFDIEVALDSTIEVKFFRAMNQITFGASTFIVEKEGTDTRINGGIAYSALSKTLTFTPTVDFDPGITYRVTIVGHNKPTTSPIDGIKDILGNGMMGDFFWTFTTSTSAMLPETTLRTPGDQSAIQTQPTFAWDPIPDADHYDIEVSQTNSFDVIYWPLPSDTIDTTLTTVMPDRIFDVDKQYFWRVRGVRLSGQKGHYSDVFTFYLGEIDLSTIALEDNISTSAAIYGGFAPIQVIDAYPKPDAYDVAPDIGEVWITIKGNYTAMSFDDSNFIVQGTPFTDEPEGTPYYGGLRDFIFPPDVFEVPRTHVDDVSPIEKTGTLISPDAVITVTYDAVKDQTTFKKTFPTTALKINNRIIVTLKFPDEDFEWNFLTMLFPYYSTPKLVRSVSPLILDSGRISDEDLLMLIRQNGSWAQFNAVDYLTYRQQTMSFYIFPVPFYNAMIYQTFAQPTQYAFTYPAPFDYLNPPYYIKEYVRLKSARDAINGVYLYLLKASGEEKRLGDLTVTEGRFAGRDFLDIIKYLDKQLQQLWDRIMGHTRRGFAQPVVGFKGGFFPFVSRSKFGQSTRPSGGFFFGGSGFGPPSRSGY